MKFAIAATLAAAVAARVHVHVTHSKTTVAGAGNIGFLRSQGAWMAHQRRQAAFRRQHMILSKHRHHMIHRYFHASGLVHVWTHRYRHSLRVVVARNRAMHRAMHRYRVALKHRHHCHVHMKLWLGRRGAYLRQWKVSKGLVIHHRARYHHALRIRAAMLRKYRHATVMYRRWSHIARVHHHAAIRARRHHHHVRRVLHSKISIHRRSIHAHNHWRAKAIRAHVAVRKHVMRNMHFW